MSNQIHNRNSVGQHLIINLYDINNIDLLSFLCKGQPILNNIIKQLNLHVVNEAGHQFHPHGYTYAFVLSESHLTIHTYPEHNSCYIDIFCCNPEFNPTNAVNILKKAFNTNNDIYHIITR